MADRDLRVRLSAEGESKVKQAIDGTAQKARQSAREQAKASREAAQAAERAAREKLRAEERAAKQSAAAARKAAQERARADQAATKAAADAVRKGEAEKRREFERTRREQERQERRRQRTIAQMGGFDRGATPGRAPFDLPRRRSAFGGMDASGLAARFGPAAMGGFALVGLERMLSAFVQQQSALLAAVGQRAGVQDVPERQVSGMDFQLGLTRLGGEVLEGDPEEQRRQLAAIQAEILAVAEASNQEPGQLLTALQTLQTEFAAFDFGRRNLRALGDEATRVGADVQVLARFAGLARQQLQLGDMPADRMFDIASEAGLSGAIDPETLAREFAPIIGTFGSVVDREQSLDPEQRLRQFIALSNVVRSGGAEPAVAATQMRSLLASLDQRDVQEEIALATGGRVRGRRRDRRTGETHRIISGGVQLSQFTSEDGAIDLAGFFEALAERREFAGIGAIQGAVGRIEAAQALNTILQRERDEAAGIEDNATFRELVNVDAAAGAARRSVNLANVRSTELMRAREQGIAGQIEALHSLKARSQVSGLTLQEALRERGFTGEMLAGNATTMTLGTAALSSPLARVLESETVRNLANLPHEALGLGIESPLSALGGAIGATRGAKGGAGTGTSSMLAKREFEEALHARPIRVEVVNQPPPSAPAASGGDPRRNDAPALRTGR